MNNPNITSEQIAVLSTNQFNWVRKRANTLLQKKLDYSNIKDRYTLLGLSENKKYNKDEQSEILKKALECEKNLIEYSIPADRINLLECVIGSTADIDYLVDDIYESIISDEFDTWDQYVSDRYYEYGESEYGPDSYVKAIEFMMNGEKVMLENLQMSELFTFPKRTNYNNDKPEPEEHAHFIHTATSYEVGSYKYEEFELEGEFRPEFLIPVYSDNGNIIVSYEYDNPNYPHD